MSFGSRRQRCISASLAIAAGGWLVDTLLIRSAPAPATASVARPAISKAAPAAQPDFASSIRAVLDGMTPAALDAPDELRDPFAWTPVLAAVLTAPEQEPEQKAPDAAAAESGAALESAPPPIRTYALQAVMTGSCAQAVVNGRILRLNDSIDGYRLVRVTGISAVFEKSGELVVLRLPRSARGTAASTPGESH